MQDSCCPFCQGKDLKTISCYNRKISQCLFCGLVSCASEIRDGQLIPQAQIKYETAEYLQVEKKWYQQYKKEQPYLLPRCEKRLKEIEKRQKPGKVLDVGCGPGFFLEVAQKHGWDVFGVDILEEAITDAYRFLPPSHLYCGTFEKASFKDRFFDTIVFFEALEHMVDLEATLDKARRILKGGGLMIITVPNQKGVVSRFLGRYWFDFNRLQHLYFFGPKTLKMVLEKSGFKIIFQKNEILYESSLESSLAKLRRYYPCLTRPSYFVEKIAKILGLKKVSIPLEHIYVIAQKV
ncbi:MAG: class I SAM-dependent methyltransferase [bacterium]|nr:class I SAM-dependent methyltransferase [bacterium]